MSLTIIKAGIATSIQDYPGRRGHLRAGFPPSGPLDSWSFRLANLLVSNEPGAAALELQFLGPTVQFAEPSIVALCGADMVARLNGEPVPLWNSIAVNTGDILETGVARTGARCYLAIAGGIRVDNFLGSSATFAKAGVGGYLGRTLRAGDQLRTNQGQGRAGRNVRPEARPKIDGGRHWRLEVTSGPHDDWLDHGGRSTFLESSWRISSKSDRTGFRLEGPAVTFSDLARNKPPENGSDPSNIIDYGYPIGGINLGGQTPIVLVNDSLTMGGFICPYTVPSAALWKLAQARPGDEVEFRLVSVDEAHKLRTALDVFCTLDSIDGV